MAYPVPLTLYNNLLYTKALNSLWIEMFPFVNTVIFLTKTLSLVQDMARDKRNCYQHTPNQLKRKCEAFLRSKQDFSGYLENVC